MDQHQEGLDNSLSNVNRKKHLKIIRKNIGEIVPPVDTNVAS
ncbi:hypothetical protein DB41_KK00250 [Neochlamydia sp. TUME1]|nr:hypothetical protein DB41_KK00250 [Neochlamydia sp. TUME1]